MKYLKLFENFEENKIPKSITIEFTKEFHNKFDYDNDKRKELLEHRIPDEVTLYPGRLHRIKVTTIDMHKDDDGRLSKELATATEFHYAVWYPETKSIGIERVTTNDNYEYEKTEENNYQIYPKKILLFPDATDDYHSYLMRNNPLFEPQWKFLQSMSNKRELRVGVHGFPEQKYENYAVGEKIGKFFIIKNIEY